MSLWKPIHHTFAPLADREQRMRAVRMSYALWRIKRGRSVEKLEREIAGALGGTVFLFGSGREALLALLQALKLTPGEEVIVQGYTCVVVANAIKAAGMVPIYCDIEKDTLNLNIDALSACITPRTRVIICQHTFGIPADTERLRTICDAHNLLLIEDCAHVLPDQSGPAEIGARGHYLLLSFGRDKAISGVTGGGVVCRVPYVTTEMARYQEQAQDHNLWSIMRLLEYPNLYASARPLYGIGIGKIALWLLARLRLLLPILSGGEKEGSMSRVLHRMPNACAYLALAQWRRLGEFNDHRRRLTRFYMEEAKSRNWNRVDGITPDLPLQKYPLFISGAERIRKRLKRKNIHLHDGWTGCVVCPASVDVTETGYAKGMDPIAEEACMEILSLPTHPTMTMEQAQELVSALDPLLHSA